MQTIIIDEEFKSLLPALDTKTFELLEENLIQNGCRDSLVLWGDILIDGHNRYEICTKHDIPFNTISKDFASREGALIWIIATQVSRRNLTPLQLSNYRGLHYKAERKILTNAGGKNQYCESGEVGCQNGNQPKKQKTGALLAHQYHVSSRTIARDVKISDALEAISEVSPEAKRMILAEEVKIDKKDLEALAAATNEEIEEVALQIENGAYEKRTPETPSSAAAASTPVGVLPLNGNIASITNKFSSQLQRLTDSGRTKELKTALRVYIDALETLYRQM